jgi:ribosomal protein S18 acetylase RimI-like enzyme
MDVVNDIARAEGAETVWLGVWCENARAIRFYEKHGFRDVGSHSFLLGTDLQTDRVMTRPVHANPNDARESCRA